jgi:hypothetical protein
MRYLQDVSGRDMINMLHVSCHTRLSLERPALLGSYRKYYGGFYRSYRSTPIHDTQRKRSTFKTASPHDIGWDAPATFHLLAGVLLHGFG